MGTSEVWCSLQRERVPSSKARNPACVKSTTAVEAGSWGEARIRGWGWQRLKRGENTGEAGSLQKHRLLQRRVKQDWEIKLHLLLYFPPSPSPSPSVCLFPFLSPSVSSPLANLHLLISIQHVYELIPTLLSLCQDMLLSNLPTLWQSVHFVPQTFFLTTPGLSHLLWHPPQSLRVCREERPGLQLENLVIRRWGWTRVRLRTPGACGEEKQENLITCPDSEIGHRWLSSARGRVCQKWTSSYSF